ncbi:MAG: hypothetical protein ACREOI_16175 [bacterium]
MCRLKWVENDPAERRNRYEEVSCPLVHWRFFIPTLAIGAAFELPKAGRQLFILPHGGSKSEPGLTFGFGKDYYPIRSFNGFFGFEVSYTRKKVTLKNRTWPSGFNPKDSDVVIGDIRADISFIEIPVRIGYTLPIKKQIMSMQVLSGFAASLPIKNHSGGTINDIIFLDPDEKGKFEFDYVRWTDKKTSASMSLQLGFRILGGPVGLDVTYLHAISNTEGFVVQTVSDRLDTFIITVAYRF